MNKKAFTLLELLVVVLIIGILAAIALPQYREAVEKSIMQEAIVNLKTIAEANERFYMINGRYASTSEIDKLDIDIPGEIKDKSQTGLVGSRIMTKYFIYAPYAPTDVDKLVAIAHRVKETNNYKNNASYYLFIGANNKLGCSFIEPNFIQKKLCKKVRNEGHL